MLVTATSGRAGVRRRPFHAPAWVSTVLAALLTVSCAGEAPESAASSSRSTPPAEIQRPIEPAPPSRPSTDLYVGKFGDPQAPPVVFLHGGPGATSFVLEATAAEELAARGFYVVTYDQRGSARSPRGTIADYRYETAIKDLADVIDALELRSPVLLAHSFGGSIALKFLERQPQKARGAILVGTPIHFPQMYKSLMDHCEISFRDKGNVAQAEATRAARDRMFPNGLVAPFSFQMEDLALVAQNTMSLECGAIYAKHPTPEAEALLAGPFSRNPKLTSINSMVGYGYQQNDNIVYQDLFPLLGTLKERVFAVYGDEDHLFDGQQRTSIEATLGTHFDAITGASHMPMIDQRQKFVDVVSRQLAALNGLPDTSPIASP